MTITKEMITIHEQEYDDTNFDFGDIQKVITPTLIQAIESKGLDVQHLLYLSHTLMFEKYQNTNIDYLQVFECMGLTYWCISNKQCDEPYNPKYHCITWLLPSDY